MIILYSTKAILEYIISGDILTVIIGNITETFDFIGIDNIRRNNHIVINDYNAKNR